MFRYKRKNTFIKRAQEELKHDIHLQCMTLKVIMTFMFSLTYFGNLCSRFGIVCDPKGLGLTRGRRDLLSYQKCRGELCGHFDLAYDPKKVQGH